MKIGETIKELRLDRGLTQDELADLAGTTAANISRIETGKHGVGSELLNSLAYVFNLKVYQLIALAEGYDLPELSARFSSDEIEMLTKYRKMTKEQRDAFMRLFLVISKG